VTEIGESLTFFLGHVIAIGLIRRGDGSTRDQSRPMAVESGRRFASIDAGWSFTCALDAGGEAMCWGDDSEGQLGDGELGVLLLQLPPTLKADLDALDQTLQQFPVRVRVVVEPRHPTWFTSECRALLEKRGAALCWADRLGRPVAPLWVTADFGYLLLHEGRAEPPPRYGPTGTPPTPTAGGPSATRAGGAVRWWSGQSYGTRTPAVVGEETLGP